MKAEPKMIIPTVRVKPVRLKNLTLRRWLLKAFSAINHTRRIEKDT
jgi:hypothetical protein